MAAVLLTVLTGGIGHTSPWSGVDRLPRPLPPNADPSLLRKALYSSIFTAPPPSSGRRTFEGRRLQVASPDPPAPPPAPPSPPLSPCQRSEVHRVYDWVRRLWSRSTAHALRASELSRPRNPIAGDPVQLWPRCSPRRLQLGVLQYACVLVRPIRVVSVRCERVWRRRVRLL